MQLRPILSALGRNKVGAALIALQVAVTLAILCNGFFIVEQRLAKMDRPSGVDERDDFTISNQWILDPPDLAARIQSDVAALRALPSVADAFESNTTPLNFGAMTLGITLNADNPDTRKIGATYMGDEHAMHTLGFRLIGGHNFDASGISEFNGSNNFDSPPTSGVLVTGALARQLAPGGEVLGRLATIYPFMIRAPIVGVIDTLEAPFVNAPVGSRSIVENSIVLPYRYIASQTFYIVRARPGQLAAAMKAAPVALAHISRQRVIERVWSFRDGRRAMYRGDRTVAQMLALVCFILLAVTAFGIIGLTSHWVVQRRRQIGIRRALGATRGGILRYFQIENLLISAAGISTGVVLALAGNLWVVRSFSVARMPFGYVLVGVIAMLVLGQLAVLWPAVRAASVPPAVATRAL